MTGKELFSQALQLVSPWVVTNIRFDANGLSIWIDFPAGSRFSVNGSADSPVYDTLERSWQHLNFFQYRCYLHARVPRVQLPDGKVTTVPVPWARAGSGFTLLFEAFSMLLLESEMPVSQAADIVGVYPQRLWNIFSHWVTKAIADDTPEPLTILAIDETSSKRGH